jgi:hypothetical protein
MSDAGVNRMIRALLAAMGALLLSGCLAIAVEALRNTHDPRAEFEGNANGRLYANYVEACYWKSKYEPTRSVCGKMIETRDAADQVEYIHRSNEACDYGFLVDKKTGMIKSWRYISSPEPCWVTPPHA